MIQATMLFGKFFFRSKIFQFKVSILQIIYLIHVEHLIFKSISWEIIYRDPFVFHTEYLRNSKTRKESFCQVSKCRLKKNLGEIPKTKCLSLKTQLSEFRKLE